MTMATIFQLNYKTDIGVYHTLFCTNTYSNIVIRVILSCIIFVILRSFLFDAPRKNTKLFEGFHYASKVLLISSFTMVPIMDLVCFPICVTQTIGWIAVYMAFLNLLFEWHIIKNRAIVLSLIFVATTLLVIYLIFIIPDNSLQEIVIAIIAALYAALLAIFGIKWTIDSTNVNNQKQIEEARKLDQDQFKRSIKPMIKNVSKLPVSTEITFHSDQHADTIISAKAIKNVGNSPFKIARLVCGELNISPLSLAIMEKEETFIIKFNYEDPIGSDTNIILYLQDYEGNEYPYKLILDSNYNVINIREIIGNNDI